MSNISFRSQAAVVTGAGGGIGKAIAVLLAARGASVVVNNRTPEKADAVVAEIRTAGGTAVANGEAVGDPGAGSRIVEAALETFGRIDILVNNAAVAAHAPLAETTEDDIDRMVRVNVRGTIDVSRAVWRHMTARTYGRVLNLGSGASLGVARSAVYAATKAYSIAFTNCLAVEGREVGIVVNTIFPMAATDLTTGTPAYKDWMARNFPPELVAVVAAYLVSGDCAVNGLTFHVGGGKVGRLAMVASRPGLCAASAPGDDRRPRRGAARRSPVHTPPWAGWPGPGCNRDVAVDEAVDEDQRDWAGAEACVDAGTKDRRRLDRCVRGRPTPMRCRPALATLPPSSPAESGS